MLSQQLATVATLKRVVTNFNGVIHELLHPVSTGTFVTIYSEVSNKMQGHLTYYALNL